MQAVVGDATVVVGPAIIRIDPDRLGAIRNGRIVVPFALVSLTPMRKCLGVLRAELDGLAVVGNRAVVILAVEGAVGPVLEGLDATSGALFCRRIQTVHLSAKDHREARPSPARSVRGGRFCSPHAHDRLVADARRIPLGQRDGGDCTKVHTGDGPVRASCEGPLAGKLSCRPVRVTVAHLTSSSPA